MSAEKSYRFESSKYPSPRGTRDHTVHFPTSKEMRFSIKIFSINVKDLKSFAKNIQNEEVPQGNLLTIIEQNELVSKLTLERTLNATEQQEGSSFKYSLKFDKIPIYLPVDAEANDPATSQVYEFQGSYDFVTRQEESERRKEA